MTAERHRCDPRAVDLDAGPITQARALRMLKGVLDKGSGDAVDHVLGELDGCVPCLTAVVLHLLGYSATTAATLFGALGRSRADLVAAIDVQLAAALDEIARPDDDGQQ